MTKAVTIHRTSFIEPEDADTWPGPNYAEDTETETVVVDTVDEAVDAISAAGCTFSATGNDWAADPDGSFISNYATAGRIETSAHLSGFTTAEVDAIMERVG